MIAETKSKTRLLAERLMIPCLMRYLLQETDEGVMIVAENEDEENAIEFFHEYRDALDKQVYTPPELRNQIFYLHVRGLLTIYRPLFGEEHILFKKISNRDIDTIFREIEEERSAGEVERRIKKMQAS
ncbi:hypothetical protein KY333_03900 [Candidatus Woesearchaeota archaeon]|nr:hypothetical protein [Candidatus Woesearchaeota archaeon]